MKALDVIDGDDPGVQEFLIKVVQADRDTAASIVSDDHDVVYFKHSDCFGDHALGIEIRRQGHVCDVGMDKHFFRVHVEKSVGRDSSVGTAGPEDVVSLLSRKAREEVGVLASLELTQFCFYRRASPSPSSPFSALSRRIRSLLFYIHRRFNFHN